MTNLLEGIELYLDKCKKQDSIPSLLKFVSANKKLVIAETEYPASPCVWKDVKQFLVFKFKKALQLNKIDAKDSLLDINDIDWAALADEINEHYRKSLVKKAIDQTANQMLDEAIQKLKDVIEDKEKNPFLVDKAQVPNYLMIRENIRKFKLKASKEESMDLVTHGILDFANVKASKETGTVQCLGDDLKLVLSRVKELTAMDESATYLEATPNQAKAFITKTVRGKSSVSEIKRAIDESKTLTEKGSWEHTVLKLATAYTKQLHGVSNDLERKQTEYNYIMSFLYPLLRRLLRGCPQLETMWGEASLAASQEMNNRKLDDHDRRSNGANIDMIVTHEPSSLEIAILEVSGSPAVPNYKHFLDDRQKLAINLKKMYKKILATYSNANPATLSRLSPIGIQVYQHKLYVYQMAMPSFGLFAFKTIATTNMPTKPARAANDLAHLVGTLWKLAVLLTALDGRLMECGADFDSDEEQTLTDISSADCSPVKKSRPKRRKLNEATLLEDE
ncbi:hypothetical protein DM01DRAFT_1411378 [Hesseltinella vesiculosa]|uniref:Uncharacterized protein n=1 Tax=Hesseltinella vesiculosa TaxID=101127 RepID=A0A1X2G442_9FUNG|nr:hypothetical protein DM01DRAFT_1411378 [Hesseltinella vesiculosa]